MVAKRFAYICAGLLMLVLAYHFGAGSARAQSAGSVVAVIEAFGTNCGDSYVAVTDNGDVYGNANCAVWNYRGNIFGGPVPIEKKTLGQLKTKWR